MRRPLAVALVLGAVNGVVALVALAVVEALTPDSFGFFAYMPVDGFVEDSRFHWKYVVVPLAVLLSTCVSALFVLRQAAERQATADVRDR